MRVEPAKGPRPVPPKCGVCGHSPHSEQCRANVGAGEIFTACRCRGDSADWHSDGDECIGIHCMNPEHGWTESIEGEEVEEWWCSRFLAAGMSDGSGVQAFREMLARANAHACNQDGMKLPPATGNAFDEEPPV